ncbi:plasmid stabilization protein [Burkholderia diffusa]|uniref:StbB family protein n=1 Tax=Burkholderia diffusa TaxID=488732 RepID=UPI00075E69BF|nr:StbB family protein [Burkholderia diffusa]KWF77595.1 plasmid stabilization protein [Burkholderia diffusa]
MKVAVLNFSGNVGKTTVAGHLLKPRMGDAPIFSVESLNVDASADGLEVEKMKGKKFGDLVEQLMQLDQAIIDVGASNVEDFLKLMQQYDGSHEEFDFFVVPVVKEKKQQADTVNTLRALSKIGIPKGKIRLLFNKVEVDDSVEDEFAALFGLAQAEKTFTLRPDALVYSNEVFERLKAVGKSLGDITSDETDYRAKLREAKDDDEKEFCVRMVALKRLGTTANRNLDDAFKALFK